MRRELRRTTENNLNQKRLDKEQRAEGSASGAGGAEGAGAGAKDGNGQETLARAGA
jgi:hypothetical protein